MKYTADFGWTLALVSLAAASPLSLAAASPFCAAQTSTTVATVPEFLSAIAVAQPGDQIVMQAGSYVFDNATGFFQVEGGVSVAAEVGAIVAIQSPSASVSSAVTDQATRLSGLLFLDSLNVLPGAGTVWLQDCSVTGGSGNALLLDQANVVVRGGTYHCSEPGGVPPFFTGGGGGLFASDSVVTAQDVDFIGTAGMDSLFWLSTQFSAGPGFHGVGLVRSQAQFSSCRLIGGQGGDGEWESIISCLSAAPGGDAIHVWDAESGYLNLHLNSYEPGAGGAQADGCLVTGPLNGADLGGDEFPPIFSPGYELALFGPTQVSGGDTATYGISGPVPVGSSTVPVTGFLMVSATPSPGALTLFGASTFLGQDAVYLATKSNGVSATEVSVVIPTLPPSIPFLTVYVQGIEVGPWFTVTTPMAVTID